MLIRLGKDEKLVKTVRVDEPEDVEPELAPDDAAIDGGEEDNGQEDA
jgi:DNA gyrase subunit A